MGPASESFSGLLERLTRKQEAEQSANGAGARAAFRAGRTTSAAVDGVADSSRNSDSRRATGAAGVTGSGIRPLQQVAERKPGRWDRAAEGSPLSYESALRAHARYSPSESVAAKPAMARPAESAAGRNAGQADAPPAMPAVVARKASSASQPATIGQAKDAHRTKNYPEGAAPSREARSRSAGAKAVSARTDSVRADSVRTDPVRTDPSRTDLAQTVSKQAGSKRIASKRAGSNRAGLAGRLTTHSRVGSPGAAQAPAESALPRGRRARTSSPSKAASSPARQPATHSSPVRAAALDSASSSLRVTDSLMLDFKRTTVSVRLSEQESDRLRQRAAESGMSVSAYMRSCVLEAEQLRLQVKQALAEMRARTGEMARERTREPDVPEVHRLPAASGAGIGAWTWLVTRPLQWLTRTWLPQRPSV